MSEQRRLPDLAEAIAIAAQRASSTVRLVGGSGLFLLLGHRRSDDIDLFCGLREDIEPVVLAVEDAATSVGVQRVRTGPGFARLEIGSGEELVRVDVASDASRRLILEDTYVGSVRVESFRDQRANKLVALLGRSELRDLVDLYYLEQAGWPAAEGFEDALIKDGGFDPAWFAWAVGEVELRRLRGLIAPLEIDTLRVFRDALQKASLDRAGA